VATKEPENAGSLQLKANLLDIRKCGNYDAQPKDGRFSIFDLIFNLKFKISMGHI